MATLTSIPTKREKGRNKEKLEIKQEGKGRREEGRKEEEEKERKLPENLVFQYKRPFFWF